MFGTSCLGHHVWDIMFGIVHTLPLTSSLAYLVVSMFQCFMVSGIQLLLFLFLRFRHYAIQLRVEFVNQLRNSDQLQRLLVSDVSYSRTIRAELHQVIIRELADFVERRLPLWSQARRRRRFALVAKRNRLMLRCDSDNQFDSTENTRGIDFQSSGTNEDQRHSQTQQQVLNNQEQHRNLESFSESLGHSAPQRLGHSTPESFSASGSETPGPTSMDAASIDPNMGASDLQSSRLPQLSSPQQLDPSTEDSTTWSYGELRMLLLSKYDNCTDYHRILLSGSDRALPMSILSQLSQSICIDLHDHHLPMSSQTVCCRALLVLVEWTDKLSQGLRIRSSSGMSITPPQNQQKFIDAKETSDILRRVLESSSAKLSQLRRDLPKVYHSLYSIIIIIVYILLSTSSQYIANCRPPRLISENPGNFYHYNMNTQISLLLFTKPCCT